MTRFVELAAASNFSFLRGASHPQEMIAAAAALGLGGLALADRNTLAGVVRGHVAAKTVGLPFAVGCRLAPVDGSPQILAWPSDRAAYGRLCRLITLGNMRGEKGDCRLGLDDVTAWAEGLILAPIAGTAPAAITAGTIGRLREATAFPVRLAVTCPYGPADRRRLAAHARLARESGARLLATALPLYHAPERRPLQDVLTAIREHTTVDAAGRRLEANAERHIKPPEEILRLFRGHPEAVAETARLFAEIGFSLDELRYEYPEEPADPGSTPQDTLCRLVGEGAHVRYPGGVPDKVRRLLAHELALIAALGYAPYFLTVADIVRFARSRAILAQGRGSAANSAVCFCLGITEVDPERADLLFERFVSAERREPPDIDVDFEHERREEVIQYVYEKYGRDRAGLAATVVSYRARSAAREIGKALGLSEDAVSALSATIWGWSAEGLAPEDARRAGLDPTDTRIGHLVRLSREISGFPRHLSQHVGGFVITRGRLDELVPVVKAAMEDRTNVEWDKDDLDALGILKIDVLALGMLTCLRKALDLLGEHYADDFAPPPAAAPGHGPPPGDDGQPSLAAIPPEDPAVYDMICRADTLGVFQIESRAQMSMLPRLKPRTFYDLVIEVAIVRPGPIQGDMVHPYLRRRQGLEPVEYPSRELEDVLAKTLGVPLFQEQAMRIAIVAAGFTPAEADRLRRAMATFRRVGTIGTFEEKMIAGMVAKGYEAAFAERCFRQIEGFGEYGFPESHAASFALLVYASCWLKCHYPDAFCAALLNSQPMGFYAPAQIVRDARRHGVEVRPVDVNLSDWDCTLEPGPPAAERLDPDHAEMRGAIRARHAVRLGLRQVKGLAEEAMRRLVALRGAGYDSVRDLWLRTRLPRASIERLADADAFGSLGLDRRAALWAARGLDAGEAAETLPLFAAAGAKDLSREAEARLPPMPPGEEVIHDYRFLSLSLRAHPVAFVRERLSAERALPAARLAGIADGRRVTVAGLVLVRQRPGTARGVIFMTLEDETGIANIIVWPRTFERYRAVVLGARFARVTGRMQSQDGVIHIVAEEIADRTGLLSLLAEDFGDWDALDRADQVERPGRDQREEPRRDARSIPAAPQGANRPAAPPDRDAPPPAPAATWHTPRRAAPDTAGLGRTALRRRAAGHGDALPKGRNFR